MTSLLSRRGLGYAPVGEDGSWLWCLGGPELYRLPMPAGYEGEVDAETCLDLNVWVCEQHEVVSAELFPYDLVPASGGSSIQDPLRSAPIALGDDASNAAHEALNRIELWLNEILVSRSG